MKEKPKISAWKQSTAYKIFLGTVAMLLLVLTVGSALLWFAITELGAYSRTAAYTVRQMHELMLHEDLRRAMQAYHVGDDPTVLYSGTNFRFCIRDADGETLVKSDGWVDTPQEDAPYAEQDYRVNYYTPAQEDTAAAGGWMGEDGEWIRQERVLYQGAATLGSAMRTADHYTLVADTYEILYSVRYLMPLFVFLLFALWIVTLVALLCAVGYHRGEEEARIGWTERIPFELWLTAAVFGVGLEIAILSDMGANMGVVVILWILSAVFVALDNVFLHALLVTLAVRLKTGSFWRTTLCYPLLCLAWRIVLAVVRFAWRILSGALRFVWRIIYAVGKWLWRGIFRFFASIDAMLRAVPRVWKTLLFAAGNLLFDCIVLAMDYSFGFTMIVLKDLLLGAFLWWYAVGLRRLESAAEALSDGAMQAKIDTRYLPRDLAGAAQTVERIGDGMNRAVEERMKSERFRTELITNVSHDIKTPLTSIVNYVDLMQKENVTEEPLAGYIEVLARQAARLKKLTEDLVEASKAATGNIAVHAERCDAGMLLAQTAGEYEEKLRAAELTLVLSQPETPILISADGRLLWRVMDNLMHNIVKYALPGSRVYLTAKEEAGCACLTFRNISRDPLNIPPEELLNRFTRGDSSRSTEGSGLGLSIATSLTELQGGKLSLHVDGDLFKVTLSFPTVEG